MWGREGPTQATAEQVRTLGEDISAAREFDDLPKNARDYVLRLEELAGAQVSCIGVGPGREATISRHSLIG